MEMLNYFHIEDPSRKSSKITSFQLLLALIQIFAIFSFIVYFFLSDQ